MDQTNKTQLYVLTGFLGAGKTTILLKLLESLKDKRVGVIQNEFGKLSIDGRILQDTNVKMVELTRGAIFCSCLKLSFVQALADMAAQDLGYLFVESSGLGDPSNLLEILEAAKLLGGDHYAFKGAICLVDGVNFLKQLTDLETVARQLKHCHLAIITKSDLADNIEQISAEIRKINPLCPIVTSVNGDLSLDFLQQNLLDYQWAQSEETTNAEETKPKSISLNFDGQLERAQLVTFLNKVKTDCYRIKGFFHLTEGWIQVDTVGDLIDFKPSEAKPLSQLVFLSKIGTGIVKSAYIAWTADISQEMQLKN